MMRGFCPRAFCPEGAYVLMKLCIEGVLSEGVLSGGGFVLPSSEPVCQALSSTSASETVGLSSPDTQRVHSFAAYASCMSLPNSLVP